MIMEWILDKNGEPKPASIGEWSKWFETEERVVKREKIGKSTVSTVFLGFDQGYGRTSQPILWETMVFGGKMDQHQDRCGGSRADALKMHEKTVNLLKTNKEKK